VGGKKWWGGGCRPSNHRGKPPLTIVREKTQLVSIVMLGNGGGTSGESKITNEKKRPHDFVKWGRILPGGWF